MPLFYESFLPRLDDDIELTWITILDAFDESLLELGRRMYAFYGPTNFLRLAVGYGKRKIFDTIGAETYSVSSVAQRYGIPTEHRSSVNTTEFVTTVENTNIDVLLSVSAPEIFEASVLNAPEWGCLNVHTSELPKYRGMLPTFWGLYHGEERIGVTVHTMVEEIDRGQIVRQTTFPVDLTKSLGTVIRRGKRTGGRLAAQALADVARDEVSLRPMDGESSYFSFPGAQERKEFQQQGGQLL